MKSLSKILAFCGISLLAACTVDSGSPDAESNAPEAEDVLSEEASGDENGLVSIADIAGTLDEDVRSLLETPEGRLVLDEEARAEGNICFEELGSSRVEVPCSVALHHELSVADGMREFTMQTAAACQCPAHSCISMPGACGGGKWGRRHKAYFLWACRSWVGQCFVCVPVGGNNGCP